LSSVIKRSASAIGYWLLAIGYRLLAIREAISCPEAPSSFVVSLNMNTDYGFFHLFTALKSLRENKNKSRFCEKLSEVEEKLPHINYSLLTSLPVHQRCHQQNRFRWERFDFGIAASITCPDYNS
jgi:hypothetical protein